MRLSASQRVESGEIGMHSLSMRMMFFAATTISVVTIIHASVDEAIHDPIEHMMINAQADIDGVRTLARSILPDL